MRKTLFISYAHKDDPLASEVIEKLQQIPEIEIKVDKNLIDIGDDWNQRLLAALNNHDYAALLLSPAFLTSDYIRHTELPRLLREEGERIFPIHLRAAALDAFPEILERQITPGRKQSLEALKRENANRFDDAVNDIVTRIHRRVQTDAKGPALRLLQSMSTAPADEAELAARNLLNGLHDRAAVDGQGMMAAVRVLVEHHLLTAAPDESLERTFMRLLLQNRELFQAAHNIELGSSFFSAARKRETDWVRYFRALQELGYDSSSLCTLTVPAYLSGQHLVTGLLARFEDNWKPILMQYGRSAQASDFGSIQSTQFTCWLVWGPSIPVCTCEQWEGVVALQFGYGDENNSIPVVPSGAMASAENTLEKSLRQGVKTGRVAVPVELTFRLAWSSRYFAAQGGVAHLTNGHLAKAQGALLQDHESDEDSQLEGLVAVADRCKTRPGHVRRYFSAYLWSMFLVGKPALAGSEEPRLLDGCSLPNHSDPEEMREAVRELRIWEHLLPVFVHANLADARAYEMQKRVLAGNAVTLLFEVWQSKQLPDDVRFYMVAASDYSGCGCELNFPVGASLAQLLAERLAQHPDRAFANSVVLPNGSKEMSPALAQIASGCHIPDVLADFQDEVESHANADR